MCFLKTYSADNWLYMLIKFLVKILLLFLCGVPPAPHSLLVLLFIDDKTLNVCFLEPHSAFGTVISNTFEVRE